VELRILRVDYGIQNGERVIHDELQYRDPTTSFVWKPVPVVTEDDK
jgi:hypothetical protein